MLDFDIIVMSWNPRGLNYPKSRDVVSDLIASTTCHIIVLFACFWLLMDADVFLGKAYVPRVCLYV
jgi:hypothetical protein